MQIHIQVMVSVVLTYCMGILDRHNGECCYYKLYMYIMYTYSHISHGTCCYYTVYRYIMYAYSHIIHGECCYYSCNRCIMYAYSHISHVVCFVITYCICIFICAYSQCHTSHVFVLHGVITDQFFLHGQFLLSPKSFPIYNKCAADEV